MYHLNDLPYDPEEHKYYIYGKWREKSESVRVRALLKTATKGDLPFCSIPTDMIEEGTIYFPKLEEFGFTKAEVTKSQDKRRIYPFHGGEEYGLKRMQEYIHSKKSLGHYASTRN